MTDKIEPLLNEIAIKDMIYEIRGQKVMFDFDLAKIYGYETRSLNQQVKRSINKFPPVFMFQITTEEFQTCLRLKSVTINSEDNFSKREVSCLNNSNLKSDIATSSQIKDLKSDLNLMSQIVISRFE